MKLIIAMHLPLYHIYFNQVPKLFFSARHQINPSIKIPLDIAYNLNCFSLLILVEKCQLCIGDHSKPSDQDQSEW